MFSGSYGVKGLEVIDREDILTFEKEGNNATHNFQEGTGGRSLFI